MRIRGCLVFVLTLIVSVAAEAEWIPDGNAVSAAVAYQEEPVIVSDGIGGAIIFWTDCRDGTLTPIGQCRYWDIYAQRVNADGEMLWAADGVPVATGEPRQHAETAVEDGAGGAIVIFYVGDLDTHVYAQRIDAAGAALWPAGGIPLCTSPGRKGVPQVISDGAGGAIVLWTDWRDGLYEPWGDLYAQRVDASGAVLWAADGAPIRTIGEQKDLARMISDGAGGAIINWQEYDGTKWRVRAQRVNPSGTMLWGPDGVCVRATEWDQKFNSIAADGTGGAVIVWQDMQLVHDAVYAQRFDSNGSPLWGSDGILVWVGYTMSPAYLVADGAGGTIVFIRYGDLLGYRLAGDGSLTWPAGGITLNGIAGISDSAPDGSGGALLTWKDDRSGGYDIYAQRISGSGAIQWEDGGRLVCAAPETQWEPVLSPDGSGGAIVAWTDYRAVLEFDSDIYAMRVLGSPYVSTLLASYGASESGSGIKVSWTLSEMDRGASFLAYRAGGMEAEYATIGAEITSPAELAYELLDRDVEPGLAYKYRVAVKDGEGIKILFETESVRAPKSPLSLYQNSPNPFNPSTTIGYCLSEASPVVLEVFDIRGGLVARLVHSDQKGGYHSVPWNGTNDRGDRVASGVYFYRLTAGKATVSKAMVLLR